MKVIFLNTGKLMESIVSRLTESIVADNKRTAKESTSYCASLMVQMVKNLRAVQEILVQSLGQEDPIEKEMATHSSILA